jgi:hypothetical protein
VEVGSGDDISEQSDIVSAPLTEGTASLTVNQAKFEYEINKKYE